MFKRPSSIVLVIANLMPIVGVLWLDWSVLSILLLYWGESVVVGLINILRMSVSNPQGSVQDSHQLPPMHRTAQLRKDHLPGVPDNATKLFLIPFFAVHYGAFCFAHVAAVVGLFSPDGLDEKLSTALPALWQGWMWIPLGLFGASHLYSFLRNFIGQGEYRHVTVSRLMRRPYSRIFVMQVAVILGALGIDQFDSPLPMLVVLVAAKTLIDLRFHERERHLFQEHRLQA